MKVFEDFKSEWENQIRPEVPIHGAKQVLEKMASVRGKQRIANIIFLITILILVGFYFYVSAYNSRIVTIGLALMVGALILRITMEIISIHRINKLDVTADATRFRTSLVVYYRRRRIVHFIATPLIVIIYCIGFTILLPAFKSSLSPGFYTYIVVSSIIVLVILAIFIAKQIRKELNTLKSLTHGY